MIHEFHFNSAEVLLILDGLKAIENKHKIDTFLIDEIRKEICSVILKDLGGTNAQVFGGKRD